MEKQGIFERINQDFCRYKMPIEHEIDPISVVLCWAIADGNDLDEIDGNIRYVVAQLEQALTTIVDISSEEIL